MNSERKKVSIVIPCRNEEKFIGRCLDSLIAQTYSKDLMEILVVNGASEDRTREVILAYQQRYPFIKLLENPKKITPISKNVGVRHAIGEVVAIIGAHSELESAYLEKCIKHLNETGADVVGGVLITKPARPTYSARAIAEVLKSRFGTGGALFRVGLKKEFVYLRTHPGFGTGDILLRAGAGKPQEADTAFDPCYRREILEKVGFFNEKLVRSQDLELNMRIKRAGGKIVIVPDVTSTYYPKATLGAFWRHNVADGIWAILPLKFGAKLFKARHLAPGIFVLSIISSGTIATFAPQFFYVSASILAFYLVVSFLISLNIALKEKHPTLVPFLMAAFFARHFGYGIGSLIGLLKLVL